LPDVVVRAGSAVARQTVPPGTRLGRYEIIATIASGGMATVYLGRALGAAGFQRLVAIKCLHPHVAADEQFVTMFMDEARLAARIRHPNVVPTLDLENGPDGLFLVMEYVEGDGLLGLLRAAARSGEPMPPTIAVRIALDVLHGLHAAHELTGDRGEPLRIVHRDVSPHNVLVGTDGITRITDFGIARAEERITHTREGQIKGKLSYMAPEQTSGEPVDRRADIWSAGVVLWECLAARRLFRGESDAEVLRNLLEAPIPALTDLRPDFPPALDTVLAKALARKPEDRFATAAEFAEALEEAGALLGVASTRAVSSYIRRLAGAKVGALHEQVRAWTGDPARTSAPPGVVAIAGTGSDEITNTPLRDSAAGLAAAAIVEAPADDTQANTDTAVRIARGQLVIPPTPGPNPALATVDLPPTPAPLATSLVAPPPRSRAPLVIGALVVLLLLALGGVAAALVFFSHGAPPSVSHGAPPSVPAAPVAAEPALTGTAPATMAPAVAATAAEPTPSAAPPPPPPSNRPLGRPGGVKHAAPTRTTTPSATPTAPPTAPAPPSPSVPFNPEAM
jgi:serine/threonine-protein kinase